MAEQIEVVRTALGDRYRVDREIGRGGMATVYLAEDLRHHRSVAVKVLHADLAHVLGPERFIREIKIAARLAHPHILPVHDSGAVAGVLYYVMPLAEGESLRAKLTRERQLPVAEAVRLSAEVARALDFAHGKGVIHRDVKPENILLAGGQAMVSDFGLALAVAESGGTRLTETGITLGTPTYMSPEQSAGSGVDSRSDLYSLGCVLFEMLAGQPPFTGPTVESVIRQHLSVTPRPVRELRAGVPVNVERAISKALSKTPADRMASCGEFARAIEEALAADVAHDSPSHTAPLDSAERVQAMAARTVPISTQSRVGGRQFVIRAGLAVLVIGSGLFARAWLSSHPRADVPANRAWVLVADFDAPDSGLAAAMQDLVGAGLDQSRIVMTVPRSQVEEALLASGRARTTHVDATLAQELAYRRSVRAVIAGRLASVGKAYTLTIRVFDADSTSVLATVSESAGNADALIPAAQRAARKLRSILGEHRDSIRAARPLQMIRTPSLEALKAYTESVRLINSGDTFAGIQWARRATVLDTGFAMAWSALGTAYLNAGLSRDSAASFATRALSRPDRLSDWERFFAEGTLASARDDPVRQLQANLQVAKFNLPLGLYNSGLSLSALGRTEEALATYRRAVALWPFGVEPNMRLNECGELLNLGRVDEAEHLARTFTGLPAHNKGAFTALVAGKWQSAESLGTALMLDIAEDTNVRLDGAVAACGSQAARGAISEARRTMRYDLARDDLAGEAAQYELYQWFLLDLLVSRPQTPPLQPGPADTNSTWESYRALRLAFTGDTTAARRMLTLNRRRTWSLFIDRQMGLLTEALIGRAGGQDERVIELLRPAASRGLVESRLLDGVTAHAARWMVAQAWERLGRPDSALAYYELATERGRAGYTTWCAHAITLPHALQKLVVLNARLGRYERSMDYLNQLNALVTKPDDEFQSLLVEARSEVATALNREGPARK